MEYIITESQLKLIKEDLGVSRASIAYANLIYNVIEDKVMSVIHSDRDVSQPIVIGLKSTSQVYKSSIEDFIEFPIERIIINFTYEKLDDNEFPEGYTTTGMANMIGGGSELKTPNQNLPNKVLNEIDKTLIAQFSIGVIVNKDFSDDMIDGLLYDLRDSIVHECNHMFEFYNRAIRGVKEPDTTLTFAGRTAQDIDPSVLQIWTMFLDILYLSEPYEVRAMSQEAYSKRLRMSFDEFKKGAYWDYTLRMLRFDAEKYVDYINNLLVELPTEKKEEMLKRLHDNFIQYYKMSKMIYGNPTVKKIVNSKNILGLMKYFEKHIHKAGKQLQKNFARVYSLQPE
jgi:hypothetical protein